MPTDLLAALRSTRLLAILRGDSARHLIASASILIEAGFRNLEVSLTSVEATRVIERLLADAPSDAWIGAGTVLTGEDVRRVRDAGAAFVVTPAVAASVAESVRLGIPVLAGALTPTETVAAMEQGATGVKLFPASFGGPAYLKALREPLPDVPFVPVGGVAADQVAAYLQAGATAVGLGSPLLGDAVRGGSLTALRDRAERFQVAVASAARR